ncbi:hypothetical protein [Okeania sp. SIO2B3]|uniref:hypothetical protein n=1 Tax=Okeania sp. SIO2B3 TaxID=2607784 RepID=UPI0013C1955B|nr:hypothetical protein [Okeania sp. SIO2B3]NET41841.1 hypothetical protein [Okeania sp. SIO2B3]
MRRGEHHPITLDYQSFFGDASSFLIRLRLFLVLQKMIFFLWVILLVLAIAWLLIMLNKTSCAGANTTK